MPEIHWNIDVLAAFVSLGGLFFGLDTGPVTVMPQFLAKFPEAKNKAVQGTLVATILLAAAISSLTSGSVSDYLSRKRTIMFGGIIGAIGCFLQAGAVNFPMLMVGRVIAGIGEGWFWNTLSVYLIEISPPSVRGRTATMSQLFVTIGITIGYFVSYFSTSIPSTLSFRIPFLVQGGVCFILAFGAPLIPYSPRWLVSKGRDDEAWRVISMFDPEGVDRQKEKIIEAVQREQEHQAYLIQQREAATSLQTKNTVFGPVSDFVQRNKGLAAVAETFDDRTRGRTIFGMALMGLQQMSGIDAVLFYAPVLFSQAGLDNKKGSLLASGVSGIVLVVSTIPSQFYLMDRWGRRPTTISGGFIMCACMIIMGSIYASEKVKVPGARWTVIALIYVFLAVFSMTWAVAGKVLTTEMQPSRTRAAASALAQTSNWLVNVGVALTTPIFLSKSPSGPYFMFGGCLFFTSVMCILWAPETLGKTLEDIDGVWEERMRKTKHLLHLGGGSEGPNILNDEQRNESSGLELTDRV